MTKIRHVLRDRTDAVAETLARAFADDPVLSWIFADPDSRYRSIRAFMHMACVRSISVGHAYELDGGGGAALWCPPGVAFFTEAMGSDDEGIVAYLESTNSRNVSLYERAGFAVTNELQLPKGPIMRPMMRQPRSS